MTKDRLLRREENQRHPSVIYRRRLFFWMHTLQLLFVAAAFALLFYAPSPESHLSTRANCGFSPKAEIFPGHDGDGLGRILRSCGSSVGGVEAFVIRPLLGPARPSKRTNRDTATSAISGYTPRHGSNLVGQSPQPCSRLHADLSKGVFGFLDPGQARDVDRADVAAEAAKSEANVRRSLSTRSSATAGLSKFHQSMLSPTIRRQRFVTGQYPLRVTVQENPTRKWLGQLSNSKAQSATSHILVNGTSIDRSLASYDRFQWLDEEERDELHGRCAMVSLELLAEIHVKKPGYVNVLSADGAGSTAKSRRAANAESSWERWKQNSNPLFEKIGAALGTDLDVDPERLWITGFSLTKQSGEMKYLDVDTGFMGTMNARTVRAIRWPNEVNYIPVQRYGDVSSGLSRCSEPGYESASPSGAAGDIEMMDDALLVSDGFLVPGRDKGGLYVVRNPGSDETEWRVCLTSKDEESGNDRSEAEGWFYHRAVWVDLTGDGRQSILTARAKRPSLLTGNAGSSSSHDIPKPSQSQLVWLERPKPHRFDEDTGTPLDIDDTIFDPFSARNTPWKVRVLDDGPDVMFSVADLNTMDDTIEVIASQFFSRSLTLHSIQCGSEPRVVFQRILDDKCGASFSSVLADLDGNGAAAESVPTRTVVDCGSTVSTLKAGDAFSHILVTSHECEFAEIDGRNDGKWTRGPLSSAKSEGVSDEFTVETNAFEVQHDVTDVGGVTPPSSSSESKIDGGSLFAYRVPMGTRDAWKTEPWVRSVIATGFHVRGQLGNMINPGAPGFCYTFYPTKDGPFWRRRGGGGTDGHSLTWSRPLIGISGDCASAAYILRPVDADEALLYGGNSINGGKGGQGHDRSTKYALMCEIECDATVGSLGIGYEDFCFADQQSGYAKIYVPCYEKDKILVFAMGNGDDDCEDDDCVDF